MNELMRGRCQTRTAGGVLATRPTHNLARQARGLGRLIAQDNPFLMTDGALPVARGWRYLACPHHGRSDRLQRRCYFESWWARRIMNYAQGTADGGGAV